MPTPQISPLICCLWSATADRSVAASGVYTTGVHVGHYSGLFFGDIGGSCCRSLLLLMLDFVDHPQVHQCKPHHFLTGQPEIHSHTLVPSPPPRASPHIQAVQKPRLSSNLGLSASLASAGACHRVSALSPPPPRAQLHTPPLPCYRTFSRASKQPTHSTPQLSPKLPFVFYNPDTQHLGKTHLLACMVSFDKWEPAGSIWDGLLDDLA